MQITPTSLKTMILPCTANYNPGGTTHPGPLPRDAGGQAHQFGDANKHFIHPAGVYYSYSVAAPFQGKRSVNLHPPTLDRTKKCVFLNYYDNNICSVILPTSGAPGVNIMFTVALSGCAFFVDRLPDGSLVAYHANARSSGGSAIGGTASQQKTKSDPSYQHPLAEAMMKSFLKSARNYPAYAGAQPVGQLFKSQYYSSGRDFENRLRQLGRGKEVDTAGGGVNVIGFRNLTGWEFWCQCWYTSGSLSTPSVLEAAQFI